MLAMELQPYISKLLYEGGILVLPFVLQVIKNDLLNDNIKTLGNKEVDCLEAYDLSKRVWSLP